MINSFERYRAGPREFDQLQLFDNFIREYQTVVRPTGIRRRSANGSRFLRVRSLRPADEVIGATATVFE